MHRLISDSCVAFWNPGFFQTGHSMWQINPHLLVWLQAAQPSMCSWKGVGRFLWTGGTFFWDACYLFLGFWTSSYTWPPFRHPALSHSSLQNTASEKIQKFPIFHLVMVFQTKHPAPFKLPLIFFFVWKTFDATKLNISVMWVPANSTAANEKTTSSARNPARAAGQPRWHHTHTHTQKHVHTLVQTLCTCSGRLKDTSRTQGHTHIFTYIHTHFVRLQFPAAVNPWDMQHPPPPRPRPRSVHPGNNA